MKFIPVIVLVFFCSCVSQKKLVYFQGELPPWPKDSAFSITVSPGDLLSIEVFTIHTDAFPFLSTPNDKSVTDNRSPYERGHRVSESGEVVLPLIGAVKIKGMKLSDASALIESKFREYVKDAVVTVKKLDYKVTVLGEINRPGSFHVQNERATLPEVLGMAGDLTQFADRKNIRIIREMGGERKDIRVDLTDAKALSFETYFVYPHDVIYVQPVGRRAFQNISPSVTLFTSILTSTIIVLTFILTNSK